MNYPLPTIWSFKKFSNPIMKRLSITTSRETTRLIDTQSHKKWRNFTTRDFTKKSWIKQRIRVLKKYPPNLTQNRPKIIRKINLPRRTKNKRSMLSNYTTIANKSNNYKRKGDSKLPTQKEGKILRKPRKTKFLRKPDSILTKFNCSNFETIRTHPREWRIRALIRIKRIESEISHSRTSLVSSTIRKWKNLLKESSKNHPIEKFRSLLRKRFLNLLKKVQISSLLTIFHQRRSVQKVKTHSMQRP